MLKLSKKIIWMVLLIWIMTGCEKSPENYVLDVDGQRLSSEVFTKRFKMSREYGKIKEVTVDKVKSFITDKYLNDLLFQAEGYAQGLDKDDEILQMLEQRKKRLLSGTRSKLHNQVKQSAREITDEDMQNFYNAMTHEIKVAHIMVRSKSLADSLSAELKKDPSKYPDFARKYSLDLQTGGNSGVLKDYFTRGTFPTPFEEAAFALEKNEISEPVKTRYGYHLIKLLDKREYKNHPFDTVQEALRKKLERKALRDAFDNFFNELFKEYSISVNEDLLHDVTNNLDNKQRNMVIIKKNIPEEDLQKPVLTYKSGEWTLEKMVDEYNSASMRGKMALETVDRAVDYLYKAITPELLYLKAIEKGYDKDEEYINQVAHQEAMQVKSICKKRMLRINVSVSDEEIETYYKNNQEKYKDKSLEKVKTRIKNELSRKKRNEHQAAVISKLKDKYTILYNDQEIARISKELNNEKLEAERKKAEKETQHQQKQKEETENVKKADGKDSSKPEK